MVLKELSKDELLNEELAYDAWVDAKYDALVSEKEESDTGEGSASPPEKGTEAVGGTDGTDAEGTDEQQGCAIIVDMYKDGK